MKESGGQGGRQLAERIKQSILGIFVNKRSTFLELLDEKSVLVSAGSKVFHGRAAYASWPLNPPGIVARNVTFHPLYTNKPDETIVVGSYLLNGPCLDGTVNQRVTINLRKVDGEWKISLVHFSNEWPPKPRQDAPDVVRRGTSQATAAPVRGRHRIRRPGGDRLRRVCGQALRRAPQRPHRDRERPAARALRPAA